MKAGNSAVMRLPAFVIVYVPTIKQIEKYVDYELRALVKKAGVT